MQGQRKPGAIASARASGDGAMGVPTVPSPVADWGRVASGDGAMGVPTVPSPVADRGRVGRAWAGRRGQWRVWREGWRAEHGERKKDTQENSKGAIRAIRRRALADSWRRSRHSPTFGEDCVALTSGMFLDPFFASTHLQYQSPVSISSMDCRSRDRRAEIGTNSASTASRPR